MRASERWRVTERRWLGDVKRFGYRGVSLCRLGSVGAYPAKGCQAGVRSRLDSCRDGLRFGIHFVYGGEGGARMVLAVERA